MAGETQITIIGNLTADPDLRFNPNGAAVANFTIASTPRNFDRQTGEWKEGETLFLRASVWRDVAENVAETLRKGMRVIAQGNLRSRSYETKEGEKRTSMELEVTEIGPSLRFASAQVARKQQGGGNYQGGQTPAQAQHNAQNQQWGGNIQPQGNQAPQGQPQGQADPWGNQGGGNYDWGTPAEDTPPF